MAKNNDHLSACFSYQLKSGCVIQLFHCITTLRFQLTHWVTVQAQNNVKTPPFPPLLELHIPKSCTEAIMRILQIITYAVREKGAQRRTRVSFGRTIMLALELLQLAKRYISG